MIKSLRCRIRIWLSVCFLWFVNKEWKPGQSSRSILHYHCNAKIENTRINQRASGEREKGLLDCLNQAKYVVFHNVQKRSCAAFEFENLCNQVGTSYDVCPGKSCCRISSHSGFVVIVMNRSTLRKKRASAMASW